MDRATFTLIVEILFYLVLCAGVAVQLKGLYKWHDRLQAPVIILNIFFIIFVMIPTFRLVVFEQLPSGLSEVPTLVTALHGLLGATAELLSIYLLLAGFKILPRKIGVLRYWMWTAFALWTLTILFGIGVYVMFYIGDSAAEGAIAEHDAELVPVEAPAESAEATDEVVAEHDAAEVSEDSSAPVDATEEVVAEHDAEEIAAPEVTEEAAAAESTLTGEHDAALAEPTGPIADTGGDEAEALIDEHAEAGVEIVEPEFTGQAGFVSWEELIPTSAETPGVRYEQAMQYNEATDRVYVFGGRDGGQIYNDVWVLEVDSVTWRQVAASSPTAPPARYSATMIVDEAGENIYLTAGHAQDGQNFNDIWKLDLTSEIWQDLTPAAGTPPTARYGSPGGNINNNLVFTHGFGDTRYDDTWQFNTVSGQWENITPAGAVPLKRCLFAAAASGNNLVIHGGCAAPFGPCFLDDAWVLDTGASAWREVLSDLKPVGRQYHTLVDITNRGRLIMYGGQDASLAARDDLWFLDLATGVWTPVESEIKPPARYNHAAVWLPNRSAMVVFGGQNEAGGLSDIWFGSF